jgi:hypothetical protein
MGEWLYAIVVQHEIMILLEKVLEAINPLSIIII